MNFLKIYINHEHERNETKTWKTKQIETSFSKLSFWSIECMQFDLENDLAWNWKRKRKTFTLHQCVQIFATSQDIIVRGMHCVSNSKTKK
jgi:hypothetical protein